MNNKEYGDLVNAGKYPDNIEVPLDTPFVDERGVIQNIWLAQSGSVTLITSKKGSVRAKHKHTEDFHASYVISGEIRYIEADCGAFTDNIFGAGQMFFTRPGVYHEMHFTQDTVFITMNNMCKNHENYEKDIVRK